MPGWNITVAHIERQRVAVDLAFKSRILPDGFQLGRENKVSIHPSVIQGLDAKPVAHQVELPLLAVPENKRKHTDKTPDGGFHAPAFHSCEHHLGVRVSSPRDARPQLVLDCGKVVNFAIKDDDEAAGSGLHRLMAGG